MFALFGWLSGPERPGVTAEAGLDVLYDARPVGLGGRLTEFVGPDRPATERGCFIS